MPRRITALAAALVIAVASAALFAQPVVTPHGRAIVQYRTEDISAVASYEYSQRNHDGPWLLIDFAVQTKDRLVLTREQFGLVTPGEQRLPLASHEQFLDDKAVLTKLFQNAQVLRRSLASYYTSPLVDSLRFFPPLGGGIIHNTVAVHRDEIPTGVLLFKSPDGRWAAGTYRLVLNHEKVKAELPVRLE